MNRPQFHCAIALVSRDLISSIHRYGGCTLPYILPHAPGLNDKADTGIRHRLHIPLFHGLDQSSRKIGGLPVRGDFARCKEHMTTVKTNRPLQTNSSTATLLCHRLWKLKFLNQAFTGTMAWARIQRPACYTFLPSSTLSRAFHPRNSHQLAQTKLDVVLQLSSW